jgi:hypothetical protein
MQHVAFGSEMQFVDKKALAIRVNYTRLKRPFLHLQSKGHLQTFLFTF